MTGVTFVINGQVNYFPLKNPYQATQGSGNGQDAFVTKFNPEGSDLVYSTFLGGASDDQGVSIALDPAGNAVVVGNTNSTNFPTVNPIKGVLSPYPTYPTPTYYQDAFVTKFNQSGQVLFSTYLGGIKNEYAQGVAIDQSGKIYVTGNTYSTDFPVTANAYQPAKQGNCDIFVARIFDVPLNRPPVADAGENVTISSEELNATVIQGTATDPDGDSLTYRWLKGEQVLSDWRPVGAGGTAPLSLNGLNLGVGQHTLRLEVSDGRASATDDMIVTVGNSSPHAAPSGGGIIELGMEVVLTGAVSDFDGDTLSYLWREGDQLPSLREHSNDCRGRPCDSSGGDGNGVRPGKPRDHPRGKRRHQPAGDQGCGSGNSGYPEAHPGAIGVPRHPLAAKSQDG